jgi:predicted acetyltransferase
MDVQVTPATAADEPVLRNLGELYAYDFSAIVRAELGPEGRYEHDFFSACDGERRIAYLLRVDGALAGFAIVARGSRLREDAGVWDMAEFFVVRRWRRQGVGARAAASLFARHPGRWEVRERAGNEAAREFWRAAIGSCTGGRFAEEEIADDRWRGWVQRFEASSQAE